MPGPHGQWWDNLSNADFLSDRTTAAAAVARKRRALKGAGTVSLKIDNGILLVNLESEILFASGSADLTKDGNMIIGKVAEGLGRIPYQVVVAGYTDNVPIGKQLAGRFANNWELAGARASRVVSLLEEIGIDSRRLIAISFGENHPVDSNDTAEGRANNRRIEFRVIPIIAVR